MNHPIFFILFLLPISSLGFVRVSSLTFSPLSKSSPPSPLFCVSCKITVSGEVQGGFYKAQVKNEATAFRSLSGSIINLPSGDAEIYVEGTKKSIEGFVRWCGKSPGLTKTVEVKGVEWGEVRNVDGWKSS